MVQFAQTTPSRYGEQTPTRSSSSLSSRASLSGTPQQQPPTRLRPGSSMASFSTKTPTSVSRRPMTPRLSNVQNNSSSTSGGTTLRARSSLANLNSTPVRASSSLSSRPSLSSLSGNASPVSSYSGTIKVSIRPRPLDETSQLKSSTQNAWMINKFSNSIINDEVGEFAYDNVFETSVDNLEVYEHSVKPVVLQSLDGYNGTVFAYGMTGSGKTYSMQGTKNEQGIIQLCINDIFNNKKVQGKHVSVFASYLEIYNEKLFDLLNPDSVTSLKNSTSSFATPSSLDDLRIRDDTITGVKVVGLTEYEVKTSDELLNVVERGDSIRKTGGTDFNNRSSRSHAVLLIRIRITDLINNVEKNSTLSLCDLAGSERATTQLERRKEGSFINKSLLALSTVIAKLSQGSFNHIPYRDSKLTRLLQPSLSGNSIVSILCTIHLSNNTFTETVNTLRFASRAKNILMNVKKNEAAGGASDKDRYIEQLLKENEKQRLEIEGLRKEKQEQTLLQSQSQSQVQSHAQSQSPSSSPIKRLNSSSDSNMTQLIAENRILNEQVEHLKRLTETSNMTRIMSNSDALQQLIELGDPKINGLVVNLETYGKQQLNQIDEMRSYIMHLEQQLKLKEMNSSNNDDISLADVLKDQEEEIMDMKRQLKSKDSIIKALRSSSKVRGMVTEDTENSIAKPFLKPIENTF
ncbi:hypothetical protein CANARDRAFT_30233 [[Candida] arabinofermentans NRRL YB-2248]|uniref:Kinesin-like protein n=1 Tax=[Candida] arabinofermentans NRRL YB-2248 TaxID=983967 RepID=A0A1E4SUI0_9ASCO|nr:hypothetical protein CANARDRAFT_30233 [[Candida] arabinofermentans NRRL YB-2248]